MGYYRTQVLSKCNLSNLFNNITSTSYKVMQYIYIVDNISTVNVVLSSHYDFLDTHLITPKYFDLMFHGTFCTDTF